MTKLAEITRAAALLTEQQQDDALSFLSHLGSAPMYAAAPAEVREAIERGLIEASDGRTVVAIDVFADIDRRIARARDAAPTK